MRRSRPAEQIWRDSFGVKNVPLVSHTKALLCTFLAHVVDMLTVLITRLAPVVEILTILTAHRVNHSIGSASTPPMSKSQRQRLNGPNVKITTERIAACSRLIALLRGPGEQHGCTQRSRNTTEEEPYCHTTPIPDCLDQSVSARQNIWTAGGSRVG